ncbi:MAG: flagellar protein FliT [Burkholderiales bacterium 66-5]|uniref:flagellar protein FliT n=1 Tax=Comamonas badia TaxID=265291 RepID=UPI0004668C6F|nr:flagellar protein FliT [Comamonas badia]OJU92658.1 MAG: flagellar protein FliT [Burkholderiales bacterium 66-5]
MEQSLIDLYRAIEDSSAAMLAAASREDWDGVMHHEGTCAVLIEQLRSSAQGCRLAPELRKEKARIMRRILDNDAQIRILAEPWLASLDPLLQGRPQFVH